MDPLDIYLMILGATLLGSAYTVWLTTKPIAKGNPQVETINSIKSLALYYVGIGVFALATGVWGIATWPLPSSYNIVLMDPWALFGAAALIVGLSLYFTGSLSTVSVPLAFLGIIPIVYGVDILKYNLTTEPGLAAALYILTGLAPLLSPFAYLTKGRVSRYIGLLIMALLVVAGIIAYMIGVGATFEHTAGWVKWTPWYG
jgi:Predicted membrane protein